MKTALLFFAASMLIAADQPVQIVLVGDSTVNDEGGWGTGFRASFDPPKVQVINLAKNGRSSKSFRDEGLWAPALAAKPNYILIQFGHNDGPGKGPERESVAGTTYRENLIRYVDEAKQAGAQPVLLTSIVRRNFEPDGTIKSDSLVPYVEETRKVAAEKNVPLMDLYALTREQAEKLGPQGCLAIHARDKDGKPDHTHLGPEGRRTVGSMAANELVRVAPGLRPALVQPLLVSPEVNSDRTATFRVQAPKAGEVSLYGDWMPVGKTEPMTKGLDGVWSITAGPLDATGHLYFFNVDGLAVADPINPRIKLRQRTSASLVEMPGPGPTPWDVRDVSHGSVVVRWEKSDVLKRTERIFVYLPPGYEAGAAKYPVLYLVHGSGDVPDSWTNAGNANLILDNLIADGKAKPMIVVMPAGHAAVFGPAGRGQNNAELFDQYLTKELIPLVEAQYRVAPGSKNRALAGLSMGGGLTITSGFRHPDLFSALGIFSPGIPRDLDTKYEAAGKIGLIWIACGDLDNTVQYPRVKQLAESLEQHGVHAPLRTIVGGAHTWPVWRLSLAEFVPQLFR